MFSRKQKTFTNEISFSGIGLHSGQEVNVHLYPAPENHGIFFKRIDVSDQNNIIKSDYRNVTKAQLGTTLSNKNEVSVSTIEHFMAAIWASRIDNLLIEMDGEEMPILDGSSEPFVFLLEWCTIFFQIFIFSFLAQFLFSDLGISLLWASCPKVHHFYGNI